VVVGCGVGGEYDGGGVGVVCGGGRGVGAVGFCGCGWRCGGVLRVV
jgi:hypothetical protein